MYFRTLTRRINYNSDKTVKIGNSITYILAVNKNPPTNYFSRVPSLKDVGCSLSV